MSESHSSVNRLYSPHRSPRRGRTTTYPLADRLAAAVTGRDVFRHLTALQRIADTSGGSRGYDRIGFTRSVDYVFGGMDGGHINVKTPAQQAVFGGVAGQMFDHCYHQACDQAGDINREALDTAAPAFAWVVGRLATYDEDVRAAAQGSGVAH